jgi:hypothetical protein
LPPAQPLTPPAAPDATAREAARTAGRGIVLFALTNTFLTGQTVYIDGGEPLT